MSESCIKPDYEFLKYFVKLKQDIENIIYKRKDVLLDFKPLEENLQKLNEIQKSQDYKIALYIASKELPPFPEYAYEIAAWTLGWTLFHAEQDNLGIDLIRIGRKDLLSILGKFDEKARMEKVRTKLPKELIGKTLNWEKQSDGSYIVTIINKKEHCKYEKLYEKWYSDL